MAGFLLDTASLVDLSKNIEPVRSRVDAWIEQDEPVAACPITVAEFFAGVPSPDRPIWDEFFDRLEYWEMTREVARLAGVYRYDYARRGQQLSTADTLLAALAVLREAVLVTSNERHFPMPELIMLNPRI
jgi:predicted nucleic acid-binding protein